MTTPGKSATHQRTIASRGPTDELAKGKTSTELQTVGGGSSETKTQTQRDVVSSSNGAVHRSGIEESLERKPSTVTTKKKTVLSSIKNPSVVPISNELENEEERIDEDEEYEEDDDEGKWEPPRWFPDDDRIDPWDEMQDRYCPD